MQGKKSFFRSAAFIHACNVTEGQDTESSENAKTTKSVNVLTLISPKNETLLPLLYYYIYIFKILNIIRFARGKNTGKKFKVNAKVTLTS